MADFGSGLGTIMGSEEARSDLSQGSGRVNDIASSFGAGTGPFQEFGQSFLSPAGGQINKIASVAGSDPNLNYNTFMSNYSTSPGAKYEIGVANDAQNNSAAASGKLLSGSNERALADIDTGIASKYANTAFGNYLQGSNTQFGQLESALGNMFNAIGVGTTATGQQAGVQSANINAQSQIAQAQAKNDQSKGSGFGSLFSGLGTAAVAF